MAATHQLKLEGAEVTVAGATVTPDFFHAAGAPPLLGRLFTDADHDASAPRVAVLGNDLWAERFASAPTVIGSSVELDGKRVTIVGVAPKGFSFPAGARLWLPKAR